MQLDIMKPFKIKDGAASVAVLLGVYQSTI